MTDTPNPWSKPCDALGPYAIPNRTAKGVTYRVAHCNRPASHARDFHQHTTTHGGVVCRWSVDGQPLYPEIIKPSEVVRSA